MPISHHHKAIFIHIPKTGGSSIEKALGVFGSDNQGKNVADENILYGRRPNLDPLQHLSFKQLKEYISPEACENYFKFAFVRNPYDRLISEYIWRKQGKKNLKLKDFILNDVIPRKDKHAHFRNQHEFITDESETIRVDFLGKHENFKNDLKKIFEQLGIKEKIPHINRRNARFRKHYSTFYTDETRGLIQELYKKDLEIFGYQFEKPTLIQKILSSLNEITIPFLEMGKAFRNPRRSFSKLFGLDKK